MICDFFNSLTSQQKAELKKLLEQEQTPKKYEFTGETMVFEGVTLNRICRLSDGELGGWIQSEKNLSHEGSCWVYGEA